MTSEPLAPGAPAIILYRQVDRDDNGHTSHEDNYFRIKILTEEGRKYANVEIPVRQGMVRLSKVRAPYYQARRIHRRIRRQSLREVLG